MKTSNVKVKQNLSFCLVFGQCFMVVTKANQKVFDGDLDQKCRMVNKSMNSVHVGLMSIESTYTLIN